MSASVEELEDSMFEDPSFEEKVQRFASDAASRSVYVTKETFMDADDDGESYRPKLGTDSTGNAVSRLTYRLHVPPFPQHSPTVLSTLALIKSSPTLDSLLPLGSQLHFALLSSSSSAPMLVQDDGTPSGASTVVTTPSVQATPYDGLHSLVHWGVAPWFDSYVNSKQGLSEVAATNKKGNEAQMGQSSPTDLYPLILTI